MREWMACLVLLVACGSDDGSVPGPDAAGPYSLTWTCLGSPCTPRPDLTQTATLAISGLTLTYGGGPGGDIHHADEIDGDGCYSVPREDTATGARLAYLLCPAGTGLDGMIQWVPSSVLFRVQAWR